MCGPSPGQLHKEMRRSYDFKFKLMVILEAEETNNCVAAKKFNVTENNVRRWRQQKNDLLNSSGTRRAFRGPKRGRFGQIEIEVAKYVADMRREGFPATMESIQVKGREIARNLYISGFKASMSWCKRMMRQKWLVLLLNFLNYFKCPIRLIIRSCLRPDLHRISTIPTHYYRH